MKYEDKVFLGHTPSEQRKFVTWYLKKVIKKYPKVHIPCVGEYTLVKSAIEAGYTTKQITCSDISLFSTLLGYFFMDKPIDSLSVTLSKRVQKDYDQQDNDLGRLTVLFYYMKINQYKDYFFEQIRVEEAKAGKAEYLAQLKETLENMKQSYSGLKYYVEDLRDVIQEKKDTVTIINPPAFNKGYERMFNFEKDIQFKVGVEEFNLGKEMMDLFNKSGELDAPFLWYKYKDIRGIDSKHAIFARQYVKNRYDYWLINKTKFYPYKKILVTLGQKKVKPVRGLKLFNDKSEITENSKVKMILMKEENALYYRDLLAHKLGSTKSETYIGITIDNTLFGAVGFSIGGTHARSLQSDDLFENFGFTVSTKKYPKLNRFLMYLITTESMRDFIYDINPTNRIFRLKRFKTTCLSKYRKVKLNNNLLKIEKREKIDNFYKLVYVTDFYKRSYSECIKIWLAE